MAHFRLLAGFAVFSGMVAGIGLAAAQQQHDVQGSRDHPAAPRVPEYFITRSDHRDPATAEFAAGAASVERRSGAYWKIDYQVTLHGHRRTAAEIARYYAGAARTRGGAVRFEDPAHRRLTIEIKSATGVTTIGVTVPGNGTTYSLEVVDGNLTAAPSQAGQVDRPGNDAMTSAEGEWTGRVTTGMMAIGGETTGIILQNDRDAFELEPANDTIRARLGQLNGQPATVRGRLETRPGVEVRSRRIITVTEVVGK